MSGKINTALLLPSADESMASYFARLRCIVEQKASDSLLSESIKRIQCIEEDGLYLHKRPLQIDSGVVPLGPFVGSVMHHVVVYIKKDGKMHSLDVAPKLGGDVTTNMLAECPTKQVLTYNAHVPPEDNLPFLYLGPDTLDIDDSLVQQAVKFAESRPYHALLGNCIHFADFIVRLLTNDRIRSAPLLYDVLCGNAPNEDNPVLQMMTMMLSASIRTTWFAVVDGSFLMREFAVWQAKVAECGACGTCAACARLRIDATGNEHEQSVTTGQVTQLAPAEVRREMNLMDAFEDLIEPALKA